jgi:hypothetical protein
LCENDVATLVLAARNELTRTGFEAAAERRGMQLVGLDAVPVQQRPAALAERAGAGVAVRAPGGLVALALALGAQIDLAGPNAAWFAALGPAITGRTWTVLTPPGARELLGRGPAFVKLADAKHHSFPARRHADPESFDAALAALGASDELQLLATTGWLDIDSEYRAFTRGRDVLTTSPYLVQDDPWTPLLHTHRASFHVEAAEFVASVLHDLPDDDVPPAAVLDVARLADGELVVLEANQCWGAGLYGCDPYAALEAVLAANTADLTGADQRWRWAPDPAVPG